MPIRTPGWQRSGPRDSVASTGSHRHVHTRNAPRPTTGRPGQGSRDAGMARLYVGAGRESGIRPGDLVGAIANEAKINSNVIGAIQIEERFSLVDVPESMAKDIIEVLGRARIKGRKVGVRLFRD